MHQNIPGVDHIDDKSATNENLKAIVFFSFLFLFAVFDKFWQLKNFHFLYNLIQLNV